MSKERIQVLELIDNICEQFEELLKQKQDCDIADWIKLVGKSDRRELFLELLKLEAYHNPDDCCSNRIGDYFRRFPDYSNQIVQVFADSASSMDPTSTVPAASNQIVTGDLVDRFKIISPLGAGGFSAVFLAHDPLLNKAVALKVIRPESGGDMSRHFECIINEANVLSRIDHPSIPKVHDAGKCIDGMPWVSMEFIKGESLYQLLATDQLSLVETLRILVKTAKAVHAVHEAGFSHRDIKPDNIIIGLDGEPRVLDYGLALHEDLQRNKSGERAGTTAFMSPEQVQGKSEDLDGRTDIWSLGVLLYLVIAKRLPFHGETKEDIRRDILLQPVKPPRQIRNNVATIELENICFRALKKDPEDRFSTAKDFAKALESAIEVLPAEFVLQEASRTRELTKSELYTIELARKARMWSAHPNLEGLPGILRYFAFRTRTNRNLWSPAESKLMAAASKHFIRLGCLLATFAAIFFFAQHQIRKSEDESRVREMLAVINRTPINEVESRFKEASAFAPTKCLDAIRDGYQETLSIENATQQRLRYAIILGKGQEDFQPLFQQSLIDARSDEIETLGELAFPDLDETSIPELDEEWRQRLTEVISKSAFVPGIEQIWEEAPSEFVDQFRSSGGKLTERYACCPRIELSKFVEVCDKLRHYRYQPVSVRPWNASGLVYVAAVWHRSSADWDITSGMTPSEFTETLATRESVKHLVDVQDGLETPGQPPLLIALWSDREDPLGKARHMLLSERIPEVAQPDWNLESDPNYCVIRKDTQTDYFSATPLLVDVAIHDGTQFKSLESIEHQKVRLGKMILQSCKPEYKAIRGTAEYERVEAGARLIAESYYTLGNFNQSADNFQRNLDSGNWQELIKRTQSYARSGDHDSAVLSFELLNRKMEKAVLRRSQPYLTQGEGRAISGSVRAEIEYWEYHDIDKFIRRTMSRIKRAESGKEIRKYTLWAEYYASAMATHAICQSIETSPDAESQTHAKTLRQMTKRYVEESIKLKPKLRKKYMKWDLSQSVFDNQLTGSQLHDQEQSVNSSVWMTFAANCDSRFIPPLHKRTYVSKRDKLGKNFYPMSYVLGKQIGDSRKIGGIWHRELRTADFVRREQRIANAFCFALLHNEDLGAWNILGSSKPSNLRKRIIETIHKFDINLSILLERLDNSNNPHERLAILNAIRPYSTGSIDRNLLEKLIASLDHIDNSGSNKERAISNIIRINVSPIQTASTAADDRDRY